jgi:hypothetical protein
MSAAVSPARTFPPRRQAGRLVAWNIVVDDRCSAVSSPWCRSALSRSACLKLPLKIRIALTCRQSILRPHSCALGGAGIAVGARNAATNHRQDSKQHQFFHGRPSWLTIHRTAFAS